MRDEELYGNSPELTYLMSDLKLEDLLPEWEDEEE